MKELNDSPKSLPQLSRIHNQIIQANGAKSKKFPTDGLPSKINSFIVAEIKRGGIFTEILKKSAPGIMKIPKFRATHPLFMLRLHYHLSDEYDQLKIFQELTQNAWRFIVGKLEEFNQRINEMLWESNILYHQKLTAFKNLLYYLRENQFPNKAQLERIIKSGIYGMKKGKWKSKKANITYYAKAYQAMKKSKRVLHTKVKGPKKNES